MGHTRLDYQLLFGKLAEIEKHIHNTCLPSTVSCSYCYVQSLIIHVTLQTNSFLYGNHMPKDCVTNCHIPVFYVTLHHKSHWFLQIWFLRNLILKLTYYPLSVIHLPESIVWVLAHAITNCYNRNPILFIFMFFIFHTNINRIRVQ